MHELYDLIEFIFLIIQYDLIKKLMERGKCIFVKIPHSYFWQKFQEMEFYHFPQIIIETSIWYYGTVQSILDSGRIQDH